MIRSFSLVVLDIYDKVLERYNLGLVQNPTGLGFKLGLSKIETKNEDIITDIRHQKQAIQMDVVVENGYGQSNILAKWIQERSTTDKVMALEYNDTQFNRYYVGRVVDLEKTERTFNNMLIQRLTFEATSNPFIVKENTLIYRQLSYGKKYPFTYPYSYGGKSVLNNDIDNKYLQEIPITISITGALETPLIQLTDESGDVYARVEFEKNLNDGEKLVINSAQKKIYRIDANNNSEDWTPYVVPDWDMYLLAKIGKSKISVNDWAGGTGFSLVGGWREYLL